MLVLVLVLVLVLLSQRGGQGQFGKVCTMLRRRCPRGHDGVGRSRQQLRLGLVAARACALVLVLARRPRPQRVRLAQGARAREVQPAQDAIVMVLMPACERRAPLASLHVA